MPKPLALHPKELLARDGHKLTTWLASHTKNGPTNALGAIGELVAAEALQAQIVSEHTHGHDIVVDGLQIEVKARKVGVAPNVSLGSKDATHLVLVRLARVPVKASPDELWAETVEIRPIFAPGTSPSSYPYTPVSGFTRIRVWP